MQSPTSVERLLKEINTLCCEFQQELVKHVDSVQYSEEECARYSSWHVNLYVPLAEAQHCIGRLRGQPPGTLEEVVVLMKVGENLTALKSSPDAFDTTKYLETRKRLTEDIVVPLEGLLPK